MAKTIHIGSHLVGEGRPPFIIAEAGVNHNGDVGVALELVRQAKRCGADCIKFQTFRTERLVSRTAPKADYQRTTTDAAESQFEMLKRLELTEEAHIQIATACRREGILFLSTPYSLEDADLLEELGVVAFKIASSQITELALLEHVARKGKPVIVSTGMATLGEVGEAVQTIRETGNDQVVVLQCTTNYPARIDEAHVRAMVTMGIAFDTIVGYSDHTLGFVAAVVATALGACILEKHLTLNKEAPGPDHAASMEPREFERMVAAVQEARAAIGSSVKRPSESERRNSVGMRRSIVAALDIAAETAITGDMLALKRPATGLPGKMMREIVGRVARRDIAVDTVITFEDLR